MKLTFLDRAKAELEAAFNELRGRIRTLPPEWRQEVIKEIIDDLMSMSAGVSVVQTTDALLSPSDAVRDLLADHPEGLRSGEIVEALTTRIRTTSASPDKILYSTIMVLRKSGQLERTEDKRYLLTRRQ